MKNYPRENWHLLEDKVEFLKRFDGFHGRDWVDLRVCGKEGFEAFCKKHSQMVAKPLDGRPKRYSPTRESAWRLV
mgnify:CR=1 FL=1